MKKFFVTLITICTILIMLLQSSYGIVVSILPADTSVEAQNVRELRNQMNQLQAQLNSLKTGYASGILDLSRVDYESQINAIESSIQALVQPYNDALSAYANRNATTTYSNDDVNYNDDLQNDNVLIPNPGNLNSIEYNDYARLYNKTRTPEEEVIFNDLETKRQYSSEEAARKYYT